jgi:hypothetical protein
MKLFCRLYSQPGSGAPRTSDEPAARGASQAISVDDARTACIDHKDRFTRQFERNTQRGAFVGRLVRGGRCRRR